MPPPTAGDPALLDYGSCSDAEPMRVEHASLERSGESPFRSRCPVCTKGFLFVQRNQETLRLSRHDRCIRCEQRSVYSESAIAGEAFGD